MATTLVRYCDQHLNNDDHVLGDEWHVDITPPEGRSQAFAVDFCPDCSKPLRDLIEHFEDIARKSKPQPKTSQPRASAGPSGKQTGPLACPDCPEAFPDRPALSSHGRRVHNKSISELLGEPVNYVCLRCDDRPKFGHGVGFTSHRRQTHGLKPADPILAGEYLKDPKATHLPHHPRK